MSELNQFVQSLASMTQPQLLTAFVACGAYTLAQSALLGQLARRLTWLVAIGAAALFVLQSAEWSRATILCVFAVAGLGSFAAVAWLTSRWLGVQSGSTTFAAAPPAQAILVDSAPGAPLPVPFAAPQTPVLVRVRRKPYPATGHA